MDRLKLITYLQAIHRRQMKYFHVVSLLRPQAPCRLQQSHNPTRTALKQGAPPGDEAGGRPFPMAAYG